MKARLDRAKARRRGEASPRSSLSGPPPLLPENLLPWAVFRSCLRQLIVGPAGGVVGVSHDSLDFKFRIFGVPPEREAEVFEKFEFLEALFVEEMNKAARSSDDSALKSARSSRRSRASSRAIHNAND